MDSIGSMLPLIIMFAILYLLIIRPQMRKQKQHQRMLAELQKGDKIVTSGGIVGKITSVPKEKETVKVSIANGVEVTVERGSVSKKIEKPGDTSDKK